MSENHDPVAGDDHLDADPLGADPVGADPVGADPMDPDPAGTDESDDVVGSRSVAERTVELLVYVPTALVVSVLDDFPALVDRGRTTVGVQIKNARLVGEYVWRKGQRDLSHRLGPLAAHRPFARGPEPTKAPGPESTPDGGSEPGQTPASAPSARAPRSSTPAPPAEHLAIFDYETLSASQVVRRLDGLGPEELEAVYRHEAASRRRRTILHRAQQLLETQDPPQAGNGTD